MIVYNKLGLGIGEACEYYFDPSTALDSRRPAGVANWSCSKMFPLLFKLGRHRIKNHN